MNEAEMTLMVTAIIVAITSRHLPRARLWIFAAFLSFAASALYWRLGLPYHPAFTLLCDASVCLAIYFGGRERWEMRLWNVFQFSVLISILKLGGFVPAGNWYPILLELCNVAALVLIGGTAIFAGDADGNRSPWHRHRHLHRPLHPLRKVRSTPPFHQVER